MLDQTQLPQREAYIETRDYREVCTAIRRLSVRGAPLIGIAAAYGLALAEAAGVDLATAAAELASTRPTAVNLRWATNRVLASATGGSRGDGATPALAEARAIHEEQIAADMRMCEAGAALLAEIREAAQVRGALRVVTHCNTGALATGGIGTALGVILTAHRRGIVRDVLVDETRPLLQGARLTAWELERAGVRYRVIVDSAAAGLMARGEVDAIVVGADRIAANGDVANKVGTYGLALAARAHGVPFIVVAPTSTIGQVTPDGARIEIEERAEDEVLQLGGRRTAAPAARALNPAFDVTPAALVTAIVTERGVVRPPYDEAIAALGALSPSGTAMAGAPS
jgi:methylthioribose-1-phosphate isomerase